MIVHNVPLISFIAAPKVLGSKEATTIVTRGEMLLAAFPQIAQVTQYVGAAYLLYLAVRIARAEPRAQGNESSKRPGVDVWTRGLLQGVLAQSLNPKAWLVALSGVSLFVPEGPDSRARLVMFCAISGVVCFASVASWAALGRLIRRWLAHAPIQRIFNRVLAAVLVLTVYSMLV